MTAARLQTVFAGLDPPRAWAPTRGRPQPQRLELGLDALPGVGVTLKRKLAKLGLETVRDLLEHRPHRYETAADEVAIAALRGADPAKGAKPIVRAHASAAGDLEIADEGAFTDIDTEEDYRRWVIDRSGGGAGGRRPSPG